MVKLAPMMTMAKTSRIIYKSNGPNANSTIGDNGSNIELRQWCVGQFSQMATMVHTVLNGDFENRTTTKFDTLWNYNGTDGDRQDATLLF